MITILQTLHYSATTKIKVERLNYAYLLYEQAYYPKSLTMQEEKPQKYRNANGFAISIFTKPHIKRTDTCSR